MLFVCWLSVLPDKYSDAIKCIKHPKIPEGVKIRECVGLFGNPDLLVIFEAKDEKVAAEFVLQFGRFADVTTSLAQPIEDLKWTI